MIDNFALGVVYGIFISVSFVLSGYLVRCAVFLIKGAKPKDD